MPQDCVVLVACAREETSHINEWIQYNLDIGFDKIYLYCNDDDPWPMFKTVLPYTYGSNPTLTFVWHGEVGQQKDMYKHFINNYMEPNSWVSFIDIDEFITFRDNRTVKEFLQNFNDNDADAVHLCWWNFGPEDHKLDPENFVLKSYTHRNYFPEPSGKIFVRSNAVDKGWVSEGFGTFFHGFGDQGMNRKHRPFSDKIAKIQTSWGADFYDLYEGAFSTYARDNREVIAENGYISHFQMRSFEHLIRRAKRKMEGDFRDQSRWRDMVDQANFWSAMAADNAEEDRFLSDRSVLPVFKKF